MSAPGSRVGIAGSLSGRRTAHAHFFRAAHARLRRAGIDACLGDDASCPERAQALAAAWVRQGVGLVIGHFNSSCARSAMPLYRAGGVELLLPASTAADLDIGRGVHRLCGDDLSQAAAIARWIDARRPGPAGVELRHDGSDYARRLLDALQATLRTPPAAVLPLDHPAAAQAPVTVVLAVAHEATAFVAHRGFGVGRSAALFADEAAVTEFERAAAASGVPCWVVSPAPSYATQLRRACELAIRWAGQRTPGTGFGAWAHADGALPVAGAPRRAAWRLRRLQPHLAPDRAPDRTPDRAPYATHP